MPNHLNDKIHFQPPILLDIGTQLKFKRATASQRLHATASSTLEREILIHSSWEIAYNTHEST